MNVFILLWCVFFVCLCTYTISSRNNSLIFNFSILFDGNVKLVGVLRRSKSHHYSVLKRRENQKNLYESKFLGKISFRKKPFLVFGVRLKQMTMHFLFTIKFWKTVYGHFQFPIFLVFFSINVNKTLFVG